MSTFLIASIAGLVLTINAWRPLPGIWLSIPVFFTGWLTGELAPLLLAMHILGVTAFVADGALNDWQGWLGLVFSAVTAVGLLGIVRESLRVVDVLEEALRQGLGHDYRARPARRAPDASDAGIPWRAVMVPFWLRSRHVKRHRGIPYGPAGRRNRLDVYVPRRGAHGAPVLLYIHGGGWSAVSNKNHQGKPLMLHLASSGWVCVSANYRVSPRVAFPDHLIDCKRALAWTRQNVARYGGDASFVVVAGGSAGGHLSALMALTANEPEYQPGFEEADTSIHACVPHYGVYDFTPDTGIKLAEKRLWFLERYVMKKKVADHREAFEKASPRWLVRDDSPPFFVIHGSSDTLVPVQEARAFVERLRSVTRHPVVYAELDRTQHAFDVFHSIRTHHVVRAVERFCDFVYVTRAGVPGTKASGDAPGAR